MRSEILIVAEHSGSELDPITYDLISWGAQIAGEKDWKLGALVVGTDLSNILQAMHGSPLDVIYSLDDPALQTYNSSVYVQAIANTLASVAPRLMMLGHTYMGIEISSGLASKLEATLWSNCQTIKAATDGFLVTRPIARGAFVSTLEIKSGDYNLITLQRGSSPPGKAPANRIPELIKLSLPLESTTTGIKVTAETKPTFTDDITKADLLVAVGRGIGQQNQLPAYRDLAQTLGGSIAASRPIVDMGWLPMDHLVGLSGRTVQPKVYLACGISGSMQHLAGMRGSRLIIAINEDSDAPIFQYAHYGVVGDINAILPALINDAKSTEMQKKS